MFLEKIMAKIADKFCMLKDSDWLRGYDNNLKLLYSKIK
jgi:hypothetical protein